MPIRPLLRAQINDLAIRRLVLDIGLELGDVALPDTIPRRDLVRYSRPVSFGVRFLCKIHQRALRV